MTRPASTSQALHSFDDRGRLHMQGAVRCRSEQTLYDFALDQTLSDMLRHSLKGSAETRRRALMAIDGVRQMEVLNLTVCQLLTEVILNGGYQEAINIAQAVLAHQVRLYGWVGEMTADKLPALLTIDDVKSIKYQVTPEYLVLVQGSSNHGGTLPAVLLDRPSSLSVRAALHESATKKKRAIMALHASYCKIVGHWALRQMLITICLTAPMEIANLSMSRALQMEDEIRLAILAHTPDAGFPRATLPPSTSMMARCIK